MNKIEEMVVRKLSETLENMNELGCPQRWMYDVESAIWVIRGLCCALDEWSGKDETQARRNENTVRIVLEEK